MKTTLSLSTKQSTSSSICKSCKRELPLESFYMNKKTQSPDKYCKECRKSLSRRQYGSGKKLPHCSLSGGRVSYPDEGLIGNDRVGIHHLGNAVDARRIQQLRHLRRADREGHGFKFSVGGNAGRSLAVKAGFLY